MHETTMLPPSRQKKPKRAMTAYNFFFKEERQRILDMGGLREYQKSLEDHRNNKKRTLSSSRDDEGETDTEYCAGNKKNRSHTSETDSTCTSSTTSDIVTSGEANGENPKKKNSTCKKKKNKKPHGKISFTELGQFIGLRWKEVSEEDLKRYKTLAKEDTDRYQAEMRVYHKKEVEAMCRGGNAAFQFSKSSKNDGTSVPSLLLGSGTALDLAQPMPSPAPGVPPLNLSGQARSSMQQHMTSPEFHGSSSFPTRAMAPVAALEGTPKLDAAAATAGPMPNMQSWEDNTAILSPPQEMSNAMMLQAHTSSSASMVLPNTAVPAEVLATSPSPGRISSEYLNQMIDMVRRQNEAMAAMLYSPAPGQSSTPDNQN